MHWSHVFLVLTHRFHFMHCLSSHSFWYHSMDKLSHPYKSMGYNNSCPNFDNSLHYVEIRTWINNYSLHKTMGCNYLVMSWYQSNHVKLTHLPPSAAYMCQWTGPALVHVMACRLFGAKPLPEPMLAYCELDSWEQISVKFESEFYHFHSKTCIWKSRLPKWRPFCPGEMNLRDPMWPGHEDTANSHEYFFLIICCTSQSLLFHTEFIWGNIKRY